MSGTIPEGSDGNSAPEVPPTLRIQIPSPSIISTRDPLSRKRMRLFSLTHSRFFSPDCVLPLQGTS